MTIASTILEILHCRSKNGDAFVEQNDIFQRLSTVPQEIIHTALHHLEEAGEIHVDGTRVYSYPVWLQECYVAGRLREILGSTPLPAVELPADIHVGNFTLTNDQRNAISMGLSSRLALILAGAGCGKTTLIRAIAENSNTSRILLCSPTGKAAKNIAERTGIPAQTVHRALGVIRENDFLQVSARDDVDLIIVDEASMLNLNMLAGLLRAASSNCRIVLVGDSNQLLSIGAGDIVNDLVRLGFPCARLATNFRQSRDALALCRNVMEFDRIHAIRDLSFDDSFRLLPACTDDEAMDMLVHHAAEQYLSHQSAQVIAMKNDDVAELNRRIQCLVNPPVNGKPCLPKDGVEYREGDRVILIKNDTLRDCWNGEVGVFHVTNDGFCIDIADGHHPAWCGEEIENGLSMIRHAYAITVHKAQGAEYDTVMLYMPHNKCPLLHRNLIYTAMSRARKHLMIYGDPCSLDCALFCLPKKRNSGLVNRTLSAF